MDLSKKYRIAKFFLVALSIACIGLGAALLMPSGRRELGMEKGAYKDFDMFSNSFTNQFQKSRNQSFDMLDHFFNDDFFQNMKEPFHEMEKMRKKMLGQLQEDMKGNFNNSWDAWFDNRFSSGGLTSEMKDAGDAYVYTFSIPKSKDQKLNVDVSGEGIAIKGEFVQKLEKSNSQGKVVASNEKRSEVDQQFSLPPDADYEKAEVTRVPGEIKVVVPKVK